MLSRASRVLLLPRVVAGSRPQTVVAAALSRRSFSSEHNTSSSSPEASKAAPQDFTLYKAHQKLTIRTMLGISVVNMFYWSSIISNHYFFAGKIVQGIDLAATNPTWGYVGVAATGLIIYFTRHFAHNVVYQAYITGDQKRVGFQVHNLFGNPGRKFEVQVGNAKFLSDVQMLELQQDTNPAPLRKSLFNSSLIPLRVEGVEGNVLIDREGMIRGTESTEKLIEVLSKGANAVVDSKQERLQYMKQASKQTKRKK